MSPTKMTQAIFRRARTGDIPTIHKLVNRFARKQSMLARSLGELYEMVRDFFVCEKNGRVIGCGALHVVWADLAEIKSVAVDGRYKGRGIGRMIIGKLHEEALDSGVEKTFVLTYVPEFFRKLGYRKIDKNKLPHKIWTECIRCPQFPDCKEVAMTRKVGH